MKKFPESEWVNVTIVHVPDKPTTLFLSIPNRKGQKIPRKLKKRFKAIMGDVKKLKVKLV